VSCSGAACTFSCQGENYDTDNNPGNGCEQLDSPQNNHGTGSPGVPTNLGSHDCTDGTITWNGVVPSDSRTHLPVVQNFNLTNGAAPDFATLNATGGLCVNDLSFSLTTSGGNATVCYTLTIQTSTTTQTCTTTGAGNCSINTGSGSYTASSIITFKVEKICSSATRQRVTYTVQGHI